MLVPFGVDFLTLLAICIPTTFAACMVGEFVGNFMGSELKDDPIYLLRLAQGLINLAGTQKREILPTAKPRLTSSSPRSFWWCATRRRFQTRLV